MDKRNTNLLINGINQQIGRIVPQKNGILPPELNCQIIFPKPDENPEFAIRTSGRTIKINLPHHFNSWAFQPEKILPLVHTYLSARTGSRGLLKDVWVSAGILQNLFKPGYLYGFSDYGNYPYARVAVAHGAFPAPETILNCTADEFRNGVNAAVKLDWCALLLDLCQTKANVMARYFSPDSRKTPAERFETVLYPALNPPKKKSALNKESIPLQDWLKTRITMNLLGRGTPAAIPFLEERFSHIMETAAPFLEIPENDPEKKESGKNAPLMLTEKAFRGLVQAEMELNRLGMIAPEQVALKLFRCARSIKDFRNGIQELKKLNLVKQAERSVYLAFTERADLENTLKQAEQRQILPGARLALTLHAVTPLRPDLPLLVKANSLLDRFEKEY